MPEELAEKRKLSRHEYFERVRAFAHKKRNELGIKTGDINLTLLKKIYRVEGIKIDQREKIGSRIRGAYFFDGDGCSILLRKDMPREPKLFSMAHELKHHYIDRDRIANGSYQCGNYNANEVVEIAAEIFAAEFIYPSPEFEVLLKQMGISKKNCIPKSVVEIKRAALAPISYTFIVKFLERTGTINRGQYGKVQFKKLEENMYPPFYKQDWFRRARARKKAAN